MGLAIARQIELINLELFAEIDSIQRCISDSTVRALHI